MAEFTKEELLKLAKLSALSLNTQEEENLRSQLQKTLSYIEELESYSSKSERSPEKNINVFREDRGIEKDSNEIVSQAPDTQDTYFVVPKILDKNVR